MKTCYTIKDEAQVLSLGELVKSDHSEVKAHAEAIMQLVTAYEVCPRNGQTVLPNNEGVCSLCGEHTA